MKVFKTCVFLGILTILTVSCSTTGYFEIPKGSELYIHERPQPEEVSPDGKVVSKPFFWTAMGVAPAGGIKYRLEKDGKVLKQGRLRATFRWEALFWPPLAIIYWPVGFNENIIYDLVDDKQDRKREKTECNQDDSLVK